MDEDDERGAGGQGLGRTLALSDGVFAIAMTLLAFQLQPPELGAHETLNSALGRLGDRYFVYFLSFAVIGTLWLAHHRLFSHVERADEPLMSLNLLFLLTVAALPFPSAVLGRYGNQRTAVVLYASCMALAGSQLTALLLVARGRRLLSPGTTPEGIRVGLWRSGVMVAVFLLSIPVALVAPSVAPFTWLLMLPVRMVTVITRRGSPAPGAGN
jgi:uncharacterized membrane protein